MLPIRVTGDINYGSGFNHAVRGMLRVLEALGYSPDTVHVVGAAVSGGYYQEQGDRDWTHPYIYRDARPDDKINLVITHPGMAGDFWTSIGGRYNILYTAWETDRLPRTVYTVNEQKRTIAGDLNKYDEVWVPSQQVMRGFIADGVTVPIHVIPHALELELLARPPRKVAEASRFYFVGSWNPRKNAEALLRAWFSTGWNPLSGKSFTLHCVPASRDLHHVEAASYITTEGVRNLYEALGERRLEVPTFSVMTAPRAYTSILDLHLRHDVFVTASRGEGFNLAAQEAAAFGNLVVGSKEACPCLVDAGAGFVELPSHEVPITPMPECRGYELDQNWWDVASRDIVTAVRRAASVTPDVTLYVQAQKLRAMWSPSAIAKLVEPRLAHAAAIVESRSQP